MDELTSALHLATDDELHAIAEILFRRQLNPLDYLTTPDTLAVCSLDRHACIDAIAQRFRFLAADGLTVLRRKADTVSYRTVLERVCRHLKLSYKQDCSVASLEAELFLHLLGLVRERLPEADRDRLDDSLAAAVKATDLPLALRSELSRPGWLLAGGSALAVSAALRPAVMHLLAKQMAWQLARYQVGRAALQVGGGAVQVYASTYMAARGVAIAAARYGAARTFFSVLAPTLWVLFAADLGWRTISTNYGRIVPAIFALAQVRLLRSEPEA